jgi:hypothetical protein
MNTPRDPLEPNDVLEHNLEKLLRRAYSPVTPRAEFRSALRARVLLSRGHGDVAPATKRRLPRLVLAATICVGAFAFAEGWRRGWFSAEPEATTSTITPPPIADDATQAVAPPIGETARESATDTTATEPAPAAVVAPPRLRGIVRSYGKPVPSFTVSIVTYEKPNREPTYEITTTRVAADATSPDAGNFELDVLDPGRIRVFVSTDERAVAVSAPIMVLDGDPTRELAFDLVRGATLRGRVIADGEPIRDALVFSENEFAHPAIPWSDAALANFSGLPPRGVRTDHDGVFELNHVSPRDTMLRVQIAGFVPEWRSIEGLNDLDTRDVEPIALREGARIEGRTRDEDGEPVAESVIVAINQTHGLPTYDQPLGVGYSEPDGSFEIADLPSGIYSVLDLGPSASRFNPDRMRLVEVGVDGVIELDFGPPSGDVTVNGVLLDVAGAPVARASLSIAPENSAESNISSWRSAFTGDDGAFRIESVEAGRYDVYRIETTVTVVCIGRIDVVAGRDEVLTLRETGRGIAGRVLDAATGAPIPEAYLVLQWIDPGTGELHFAGRSPVGPDASFRLANLRDGDYRLGIVAFDGEHGALITPPIAASDAPPQPYLLPRGGSALVAVRYGTELVNVDFTVLDATGVDITGLLRTNVTAEGSFEILGLPAGEATIAIRHEGFVAPAARITIEAGRRATLTIDVTRR